MIQLFRTFFILFLLSTMSYFGYITHQYAKKYEESTSQIAMEGDAHNLASGKIDNFTTIISLGLLKNQHKITLEELRIKQSKAKSQARRYLYYFIGTLTILILFSFACSLRGATLSLSFATLIALIYGLINPILMITIHKQVDYLGDVILSFESKGIIGSIEKLYGTGELAVALTIFIFSIIIPILKSLTLTITLLFYQHPWSHGLVKFFKQIGKWSMIDVFVVATLLVYLTSNGEGVTHAEIQVGLYFFLIYVLLSMVTAIQTEKVLKQYIQ